MNADRMNLVDISKDSLDNSIDVSNQESNSYESYLPIDNEITKISTCTQTDFSTDSLDDSLSDPHSLLDPLTTDSCYDFIQPFYNRCTISQSRMEDTYVEKERYGRGVFGTVFRALSCLTGRFVTVKHIKYKTWFDVNPLVISEIALLKRLNHLHVVRLIDVVNRPNEFLLVFENQFRNLYSFLKLPNESENYYKHRIPVACQICRIFQQTCMAIQYCHRRKIVHGNLKPQNILIDVSGSVKVTDVGLLRLSQYPFINYNRKNLKSLPYLAPEIIISMDEIISRSTPASDIWSLGCIFGELFQGSVLICGSGEIDHMLKIFQFLGTIDDNVLPGVGDFLKRLNPIPQYQGTIDQVMGETSIGKDKLDCLKRMLKYRPSDRITALQLCEDESIKACIADWDLDFERL